MLMPENLATAFNDQITLEFQSSLAYLQMSAFFEQRSLRGMATWMRIQSEEERAHALRFFDYVLERGNQVALGAATPPRADFSSPVEVFEAALTQEQTVSASIANLYRVATSEGDVSSFSLLQWFLNEQVEEEATVSQVVDQLRLIGSDGAALLLLDRELAARPAAGTAPPAA